MNNSKNPTVRIFISSPGDVHEERKQACRVVENLQRKYPDVNLVTVLWENLPLPSTATFQESIDILLNQQPIDIAIFILWSRLGTPIGPQIARPDGSSYRSGTEREFDLMLAAYQGSGEKKRPMILTYTRNDDEGLMERVKSAPKAEREEILSQSKLADEFIRENFKDDQGRNLRAYYTYPKPITFAQKLHSHLDFQLSEMLAAELSPRWSGEPYRGLQFFDIEHGPIFQGRDQETCEVLERLQSRLQAGCGSVVIVGASGSGKSSLARAGVAATLQHHAYDSGVKEWRVASLIPGRTGNDLFGGLTRAIALLPDPDNSPSMLEDLAAALAEQSADKAVRLGVNLMFERAAKRAQGVVRLLLIVDQLEELWTDARITPALRKQFLNALLALARSGHVGLLLTLRSDFYSEAQQSEEFLALKEGQGHFDLVPPGGEVLHRLITEPARLAGLRFEHDPKTGRALDQEIAKAAAGNQIALPLLQDALSELYQKRDGRRNLLTLEAYDELGGLEGAIGRRAEKIVADLPPEVRASLPDVMRRLTVLREGSDETFTAARIDVAQVASTPQRRALVDALVEARLLVLDKTESGATVGFAHEALLKYWPRLKQLLEEDREFLRVRQRIKSAAVRWREERQNPDYLLPAGKPLAEGRDVFFRRKEDLDNESAGFIALSVLRDESTRRRRLTIIGIASLAFCLVCVISSIAFYVQKSKAEIASGKAIVSEELAQRNLALVRVNLASRTWQTGDVGRARKFLDEMPEDRRDWEWRYVKGLCDRNRLTIPVGKPLTSIDFSPGGDSFLVSWAAPKAVPNTFGEGANSRPLAAVLSSGIGGKSEEGGVAMWNTATGARTADFPQSDGPTLTSEFVTLEGDGTKAPQHIVSVSRRHTLLGFGLYSRPGWGEPATYQVQLWKTGDSAPTRSIEVVEHFVKVRRDGYVALATNQKEVTESKFNSPSRQMVDGASSLLATGFSIRVFNLAAEGSEGSKIEVKGAGVTSLLFHPDGKQLITSHQDGAIHFWDIHSGALSGTLPNPSEKAELCAISGDGSTLATTRSAIGEESSSLEIWDAIAQVPRRTLQLNVTPTQFALDMQGNQLAVSGWDNTVRVWDARTGEATHHFRGHADRVTDVVFHPHEATLASCSKDETVKLWDLKVRDQRAMTLNTSGRPIQQLAIPDGGTRVAIVRQDRVVELWNASTGTRELEVVNGGFAALNPRGDILATGEGNLLLLHSLESGERRVIQCTGHEHEVSAAAFSKDGERVASVDEKGMWIVWRVKDGQKESQIPELAGMTDSLFGARFSSDGKHLLGHHQLHTSLFVWELESGRSGKPKYESYSLSGMLRAAGMSEDGKRIMALSGWGNEEPSRVNVWDFGKKEPLFTHHVAAGIVNGAAFSPNGNRLFTSISDKGVQVWDVDSGMEILTLTDFGENIHSLVLSANGDRLAGVNPRTQTIKIWDASP